MSTFPSLKTGAVLQYPATRELSYATEVFRFVDGGEQRCRQYGGPLRRWVVRLDLLDDAELRNIEEFFHSRQGALGSFRFVDPWDGVEHADCSLERDELTMELAAEQRGRSVLAIRENRI